MQLSWIARGAASADRARRQMELRGCTPNGHPLWERWEVEPLVGMYPGYASIFPLLTRRTKPGVYSKAGRLGITQPRHPWTDNEILRLRIYRTGTREEILATFPGRSWGAIAKVARKRGHHRPKAAMLPSGIRLIDQIHERCVYLRMSLSELDAACDKTGYFTQRRWRRRPDAAVHERAVVAMGGRLRASFGVEVAG